MYGLDIPTLGVLEDSLLEFAWALVLVTHDRWLVARLSAGILELDESGRAEWFVDYPQWEAAQAHVGRLYALCPHECSAVCLFQTVVLSGCPPHHSSPTKTSCYAVQYRVCLYGDGPPSSTDWIAALSPISGSGTPYFGSI